MKRYFYFLAFIILLSSCTKMGEEKGDVNLTFYLQYKGQPLVMFDTFVYPVTNQNISFTKFACYLSEIALVKNNGEILNLKDIDYVDLTNAHSKENAVNGFTYSLKDVAVGDYKNVQFAIGVPVAQNAKEPKDFSSNHVLSNTANFWTSWKSYIFSRTEGKIDFDANGTLEDAFTLHVGGDEAYTNISLSKSFSVLNEKTTDIGIVIDMEKYFNGKTLYDIVTTPAIHSLEHKPAIQVLKENLKTAIFLK
ncbi:MAG: MbnP family protein [Saprospiraceae bacterium]